VSGPLLDRIDLRVVMPRLEVSELVGEAVPEESACVAERIRRAWERGRARSGTANGQLRGRQLVAACAMDGPARRALADTAQGLELTARSVHRLMRVARTIADLRDLDAVGVNEVLAAASLRDRSVEMGAAA